MSVLREKEYLALWSKKTLANLVSEGFVAPHHAEYYLSDAHEEIPGDPYDFDALPMGRPTMEEADPFNYERIKKRILEGASVPTLKKEFEGIYGKTAIYSIRRKLGNPEMEKKRFTEIEYKMLDLRSKGKEPMQIAIALQIPHKQVLLFVARVKGLKSRGTLHKYMTETPSKSEVVEV